MRSAIPRLLGHPASTAVAAAVFAACAAEPGAPPRSASPTASVEPWSDADALPILRCEPLRPIRDADLFDASQSPLLTYHGRWDMPIGMCGTATSPAQRAAESPFASNAEAVAFALAWVEAHFGALPAEVRLEATSTDNRASGNAQFVGDADRGHTIVLQQRYRGLETDRQAVVHIEGRTVCSATVGLAAMTPVAVSGKRCVDRSAAVAAWRGEFAKRAGIAMLARFDRDVAPQLVYAASPAASGHDASLLHPTWRLLPESPFMVDGHSGKAWYND